MFTKKIFLFTCVLFVSIFANAADMFTVDGITYFTPDDKTAYVTYTNVKGDKIIPSKVKNYGRTYSVTSIGTSAFAGCRGLTSIEIPSSVTSIGEYAFSGCIGLTSIEIPNSVTSIGSGAFRNCTGLTSIEIPSRVTSIRKYTFSGCTGLTSIEIPNSVTSIGEYAFSGCTGLTSIEIPSSVTSIGNDAFTNTPWYENHPDGLVYVGKIAYKYKGVMPYHTSIVIKDGTVSIVKECFKGHKTLTSITVPGSVISVGDSVCVGCSSLTDVVWNTKIDRAVSSNIFKDCPIRSFVMGEKVTSIVNECFKGLTTLASITIPNSVTSIGNSAFDRCTGLASIEIPNSVTSIGSWAFYGCTGLTSIEIPNSVKSIGEGGFYKCTGLSKVIWNAENCTSSLYDVFSYCPVTEFTFGDKVKVIPESCCSRMSSLTSIKIPAGVTSIGDEAFLGCRNLTSIEIPSSVTSIGNDAFTNTPWYENHPDGLVYVGKIAYKYKGVMPYYTSIVIKDGTVSIGNECFKGYKTLTSITVPGSVTSVGDSVCVGCSSLTNVVWNTKIDRAVSSDMFKSCPIRSFVMGEKVTSIVKECFKGLTTLASITISNSVTSIGSSAFSGCTGLTSLEIPNSVKSIGGNAFNGCKSLTSITVPGSVTSIGDNIFAGCSGLTDVVWNTKIDRPISSNLFKDCPIQNFVIGENVTSIVKECFKGLTTLQYLEIQGNISSMGDYAFSGCTSLSKVMLNAANCTTFSITAFGNCPITEFTFGDKVKVIPERCCYGMSRLTSIVIPDGVTSIGNSAFSGCTGLTSLKIPSSVKSIGGSAFYNCRSLTSIKIPEGVTSIGGSAFKGCTGLTSIEIPSSVTSIGESAFNGCTGLTSVTVPGSVTSIGDNIFAGCSGLTDVVWNTKIDRPVSSNIFKGCPIRSFVMGETVTSIVNECFKELTTLASITIPNNVTSIGNVAFSGCAGLTSIEIPSSVTLIGESAFNGCTGLTSVTVPGSVTSIGDNVFSGCSSLTDVVWNTKIDRPISSNLFKDCPIKNFVLGDNVTSIVDECFKELKTLVSIEISSGVTKIGEGAFGNCIGLTSVEIPVNVKSIGDYAFSDCNSLSKVLWNAENSMSADHVNHVFNRCPITEFIFGDNVKVIPSYCCYGMSLTSIKIPNSVTSIGFSAFAYCGLTSIELPSSVTSIGNYAFQGCTGLTSVTIPNSVTSIGNNAFAGCSNLTDVVWDAEIKRSISSSNIFKNCPIRNFIIGDNVTSIVDNCFKGLTTLASITIPSSVSSIGSGAFSGCSNLDGTIKIPSEQNYVGANTFNGCSKLSSVEMHSGVTEIQANAFTGCSSLKDIDIPVNVTDIGNYAFSGCTGLTSILIPSNVETLGTGAFSDCSALKKVTCLSYYPPADDVNCFKNYKRAALYVPCNRKHIYEKDEVFGQFVEIFCVEAEPVDDPIKNPVVEPEGKSVEITWPIVDGADKYVITITRGGEQFCTLTFDSNGQLLNIEYAVAEPSAKSALTGAESTSYGYRFNVTGLTEGTEYAYSVSALNVNGNVIKEFEGSFRTSDPVTIEENQADNSHSIRESVLVNGNTISVDGIDASDIRIFNTAGKQVSNPVPNSGVYVVTVGGEAVKVIVR